MSGDRYCSACGAAIEAPSAFCGHCGAALAEPEHAAARRTAAPSLEAPPPEASRKWIPFAAVGGVIAVTVIVAILLSALGGSAGKNVKGTSVTRAQALQLLAANGTTTVSHVAPGLFAAVATGKLTALVPAGWRATAQTVNGTSRAEFADPRHPDSTLTIVAQAGNRSTDNQRAVSARRAATARGYTQNAFGPVSLPGGRAAWRLTYTNAGVTHETYFYSSCGGGATSMVVDISAVATAFAREQPTLAAAVAGAEPMC